jgi:hypothetical protein
MAELMRQAQRMQRKMDKIRSELKDHEMSASVAGGKVTAVVTCEGKVRSLEVDPAFLEQEGLEMALDSVVAATNNALAAADAHVEAEMEKVTGGIKIPGM